MNHKKDKDIVLEAVKNDGYSLEYADKSFLKTDREIVLAPIQKYGWVLIYAGISLRNDREMILEAI